VYKLPRKWVKLGRGVTPSWGEIEVRTVHNQIDDSSPQVINYYPQEIPARIGNRPPIKIN